MKEIKWPNGQYFVRNTRLTDIVIYKNWLDTKSIDIKNLTVIFMRYLLSDLIKIQNAGLILMNDN